MWNSYAYSADKSHWVVCGFSLYARSSSFCHFWLKLFLRQLLSQVLLSTTQPLELTFTVSFTISRSNVYFIYANARIVNKQIHEFLLLCQPSQYRKVPWWGVSNGASHNWKCILDFEYEGRKFGRAAQIQPKSQFLFHKNLPPRDFFIMTLVSTAE